MADVAQLVRASVCGTECREFESHHPPQFKPPEEREVFLLYKKILVFRKFVFILKESK